MRNSVAFTGLFLAALTASTALAPPFGRTFVSAQRGNDASTCSPTAPCRTFARAMFNTAPNGEIIVLDSGGYGPSLVIDKAVQIQAPAGVYAGITTAAGISMIINAATTDSVVLKGLTFNSNGATDAIDVDSVGSLHVDGCTISGFSNSGVVINVAGELFVRDSTFRRNGSGIQAGTIAGSIKASIDGCTFEKGYTGVLLTGNVKATVRDCVLVKLFNGFFTQKVTSELTIENSMISHNEYGVYPTESALIRVSNCIVTNNGMGLSAGYGTVLSRGNNTIEGNTYITSGTIGSYVAK